MIFLQENVSSEYAPSHQNHCCRPSYTDLESANLYFGVLRLKQGVPQSHPHDERCCSSMRLDVVVRKYVCCQNSDPKTIADILQLRWEYYCRLRH